MSRVYVVRFKEEHLGYLEGLVRDFQPTHSGMAEEIEPILQTARPEHPDRQAALEKLADVCHAVQGKITWDDAHSQEAFMDALETVCRLRSLEGK